MGYQERMVATLIQWARDNVERYKAGEEIGIIINEEGTIVSETRRAGKRANIYEYYLVGKLQPRATFYIHTYKRKTGLRSIHIKASDIMPGQWADGALETRAIKLVAENTKSSFLTRQEVEEYLGVSTPRVYQLRNAGLIIPLGTMYEEQSVRDYAAKRGDKRGGPYQKR